LKKVITLLFLLLCSLTVFAQNGPTAPTVSLNWNQSVGSDNPIAKNCIYRGLTSGVYQMPALACITAGTSYVDKAVTRGTTYFYAVTAQDSKGAESNFSSEVSGKPPIINAPTLPGVSTTTKVKFPATITISKDGTLVAKSQ
jgi:fibronectin type 3 domain-containing protein